MRLRVSFLLILFWLGVDISGFAQTCPQNIGFETGNFAGWELFVGSVKTFNGKNVVTLNKVLNPVYDRHTILSNPAMKDIYGGFSVVAPNSSQYSVKLGNSGTGALADGIKYRFTVPNKAEYSLSYQYAVVFEDPGHPKIEQPFFSAKVIDASTGKYVDCASFEYIATSGLPGFYKSKIGNSVLYKDWTTVTLNLSGYQNKELILEFITADCTISGHFGYAYVDVNEDCESIIKGNEVCENATSFTLIGPAGYKEYNWYSEDRSIKYGSGEQLKFNTLLKNGSKIIVDLIPYPGFGCPNTVSTIVKLVPFELKTVAEVTNCIGSPIDILSDKVILNKSVNTAYTCFEDANLTKQVLNTANIFKSGTYYVKAASAGCTDIKPVKLIFKDYFSSLQTKSPLMICSSEFANLTNPNLLENLPQDAKITYFSDKNLSNAIPDASKVKAGTYYLKITKDDCSTIREITVSNYPDVVLKVTKPNPFCLNTTADLTNPIFYVGSSPNLTYTFYEDVSLLKEIGNPKLIINSGKYYIKAVNSNGCTTTGSIDILFENPTLKISNPAPVCYPESVDITSNKLYLGTTQGVSYSYFNLDNSPLNNPKNVKLSGKYYVVISNQYGCSDRREIEVTINDYFSSLQTKSPLMICSSEFANLTNPNMLVNVPKDAKITYFKDKNLANAIADPSKVGAGSYYIKVSKDDCSTIREITVSNYPDVVLKVTNPNPFCENSKVDITDLKYYFGSTNNLKYAFYVDNSRQIPLENPKEVTKGGRYYVEATSVNGCKELSSIDIKFENPVLTIKDPIPVCYPQTVDITATELFHGTTSNVKFNYLNLDGTIVGSPTNISHSGTFLVEIVNQYGCTDRKQINVLIYSLPIVVTKDPKKTLEPNTVNLTDMDLRKGSTGFSSIEYFEDSQLTQKVLNPSSINRTGTYYLKFSNEFGCYVVNTMNVVIGKKPAIVVPTAFTPLLPTNNRIFPFLVSVKKMISFKIYNKWGNLMFVTKDASLSGGWNGYYKGKLQSFETYTWLAEAIDEIDNKFSSKGQFVMIP